MCEFCGWDSCTLTKKQVLERGNILEGSANSIIKTVVVGEYRGRFQGNIYSFTTGFPSSSALIPDKDEEDPHLFLRYGWDEDKDTGGRWAQREIDNPLVYQTEREFLNRILGRKRLGGINMWLLKLHFSISVLCLITFTGFKVVFRQSIKDNGWIDETRKKRVFVYLMFFVPVMNVLAVILLFMMIVVKKKEFDRMCEEAKKGCEVSDHE